MVVSSRRRGRYQRLWGLRKPWSIISLVRLPWKSKTRGTREARLDDAADQRALVQVGVHQMGAKAGGLEQAAGGEEHVEVGLAPGGADAHGVDAQDARRTADVHPWQVPAAGVGAEADLVPQALEGQGFFQDAHVAAVVGEEGGGGDRQDAQPGRLRCRLVRGTGQRGAIQGSKAGRAVFTGTHSIARGGSEGRRWPAQAYLLWASPAGLGAGIFGAQAGAEGDQLTEGAQDDAQLGPRLAAGRARAGA